MSAHNDCPDVKTLWDKCHIARRQHLCTACGEEISSGVKYRSTGLLVDGVLDVQKLHGVGGYPSSCPRFADRDRAELSAQFEQDQAQFFPTGAS